MDRYQALKQKFQKREKICGTHIGLFNNPLLIEMMNRDDLDFLLFDNEHGAFNNEGIVGCLQVCRLLGLPSIVRVPKMDYAEIARAIDLGADGIMLPRTETLEQVKATVEAMRFYPVGKTGFGGHGQFRKNETIEEYQSNRHLLIQIESPTGIKNLPQILDNYSKEISAIVIGPFDMSFMVGTPTEIDSPENMEQINEIFKISEKYGKSCGLYCANSEKAKKYRKLGANFIWLSTEYQFLLKGYKEEFDEVIKMD